MGFPRPEHWSRLIFLTSGDPPYPEIEPVSCLSCIGRQILFHYELLHFEVFRWNITSWARSSLIVPLGTLNVSLFTQNWVNTMSVSFFFSFVSSASPTLMNDHRDKKHLYNSVWKKSVSMNKFLNERISDFTWRDPQIISKFLNLGSDNFLSSDL